MSHVPTAHNTHVYWGRIMALGSAILLAFTLGFCVAPGDQIEGVNPEEHAHLRTDLATVLQENSDLQSRVDALRVQLEQGETPNNPPRDPFSPIVTEPPLPTEEPTPGPMSTSDATGDASGMELEDDLESSDEYTVQPGDTIASIAAQHYGDIDFTDLIVEANDITDPTTLEVGQVLRLPPP